MSTEREKVMTADAYLLTEIRARMSRLGARTTEEAVTVAEFKAIRDRVANERGVSIEELESALRAVGEHMNAEKARKDRPN